MPVAGYADYEVSSHGRVRRARASFLIRPNGKLAARGVAGTFLTPRRAWKRLDYLVVSLRCPKSAWGSRKFLVHRLVAQAFLPNPTGKPAVNHKDSDPANNHVGNLEWCTFKENTRHAYDKGIVPRPPYKIGLSHGMAKLNAKSVRRIRRLALRGEKSPGIAAKIGVHKSTVERVLNGRRWSEVT